MNKLTARIAQTSSRNIRKKKILIAVGSLSGGGAERVASVWAGQLAEKGYDVSIFIYSHKEDEYPISPQVKLYSCANTANEYVAKSLFARYKEIRQIIKSIKPDYIIPFLFSIQSWMFITSVGLRIKRVETLRINPWASYANMPIVKRLFQRVFYNTSYRIILQASDQKPWFSKRNQKKCVLIPNPISDIYNNSYREEISTQAVNFIAAGRIDPQKNYPMMIDAFAKAVKQYPNIRLQIFG
jgi:glycosyltransferase involved in cell wall biosynthesis